MDAGRPQAGEIYPGRHAAQRACRASERAWAYPATPL